MRICSSLAILMLAAAAAAQEIVIEEHGLGPAVLPGANLGDLPEVKWLAGGPVKLTGADAVQFTVACCAGDLAALRQQLDHLQDLQRRLRGKPVQLVAVLAGAGTAEAVAQVEPGLPVAHDPDGALSRMLVGDASAGHLAVFDRDGKMLLLGQFAWGLAHAVERIAAGKFDVDQERRDLEIRVALEADLAEVPPREAMAAIDALLQHNPHDGLAWGMKYLMQGTRLLEGEAARATLQKAIVQLATDPAPLGRMAELALRGDPANKVLGRELVPALTPAAAQAPRDLGLQLTLLRALVRAGVSREVGRLSRVLARPAGEDPAMALTLAEILAGDATPQAHATTAQKALERAAAGGVDPRLLTAVRYAVTLRCLEDKEAAQKIAAGYMEQLGGHTSLNNDAWYMMTQVRTMGRGNVLALAIGERMLEEKDKLDAFEYDTVALAMFLNGRVQEAVELQTTALEKGGGSDPDAYRERQRRYQAALDKAPAKDAAKDVSFR